MLVPATPSRCIVFPFLVFDSFFFLLWKSKQKSQNANSAQPLEQHISHHGQLKATALPSTYQSLSYLGAMLALCSSILRRFYRNPSVHALLSGLRVSIASDRASQRFFSPKSGPGQVQASGAGLAGRRRHSRTRSGVRNSPPLHLFLFVFLFLFLALFLCIFLFLHPFSFFPYLFLSPSLE